MFLPWLGRGCVSIIAGWWVCFCHGWVVGVFLSWLGGGYVSLMAGW